jgi:hypothetical protein
MNLLTLSLLPAAVLGQAYATGSAGDPLDPTNQYYFG